MAKPLREPDVSGVRVEKSESSTVYSSRSAYHSDLDDHLGNCGAIIYRL